jgi:hypothetical protein
VISRTTPTVQLCDHKNTWDDPSSCSKAKCIEEDNIASGTKLHTLVLPGTVPTLERYTLMTITEQLLMLEGLPGYHFGNQEEYSAALALPIFQILINILELNVQP